MSETYRVTGPHRVDDHDPGSTFQAELPPWRREALIRGHHIEVVPDIAPKARRQRKGATSESHPREAKED